MAAAISALSNLLSSILTPRSPPPNVISLPSPASLSLHPLPKTASTACVRSPPVKPWISKRSSGEDDMTAVAWPALANANILFYFNVQIKVDDEEPEEKILRRFRSAVMRAGIIQECKRRRFFENSQEKRKRKARSAAQRNRKRRPKSPPKQEAPKEKGDDEEDNWEVPEGDIPYC